MVVQLKTKTPDGRVLQGNGLMFFANPSEKVPLSPALVKLGFAGVVEPIPVIATLWHVIGLSPESPDDLSECVFTVPSHPKDSAPYCVSSVIARCSIAHIDPTIGAQLKQPDGLCLLTPGMGYYQKVQSPTRLATPTLESDTIVTDDVSVYLFRGDTSAFPEILHADGQAQKRLNNDAYEYPGGKSEMGFGTSGALIIPKIEAKHPPQFVFGLHCGREDYPQPPDKYVFLGATTLGRMINSVGLHHPVVPYSGGSNGKQPAGIVENVTSMFRRWLDGLAPS